MAVRILLKNGQVKNYKTWYESSYDGGFYYGTGCKMEFRKAPHELDGCNHIECAIKSANWGKEEYRKDSRLFAFVVLFWIIFALIMVIIKSDFLWSALMFAAMYAAFSLIHYYIYTHKDDSNEYMELIEFKEHGTINGIEAEQI